MQSRRVRSISGSGLKKQQGGQGFLVQIGGRGCLRMLSRGSFLLRTMGKGSGRVISDAFSRRASQAAAITMAGTSRPEWGCTWRGGSQKDWGMSSLSRVVTGSIHAFVSCFAQAGEKVIPEPSYKGVRRSTRPAVRPGVHKCHQLYKSVPVGMPFFSSLMFPLEYFYHSIICSC